MSSFISRLRQAAYNEYGDTWTYYAHKFEPVERVDMDKASITDLFPEEIESSFYVQNCEGCGPVPPEVRCYGVAGYDDPDCTVPSAQYGGGITQCESCILDAVLEWWNGNSEIEEWWYVK